MYNDFIAPMQLLMSGIDAIRDQDFNVKFLKSGKLEMDELIEVYNQMIDRLRQERTLQEQQHYFLEKLIQTSPTGILILDFDHHISEANAKALEITGATLDQLKAGVCTVSYTHLEGTTIVMVTHDENMAKKTNRLVRLFDGSQVQ